MGRLPVVEVGERPRDRATFQRLGHDRSSSLGFPGGLRPNAHSESSVADRFILTAHGAEGDLIPADPGRNRPRRSFPTRSPRDFDSPGPSGYDTINYPVYGRRIDRASSSSGPRVPVPSASTRLVTRGLPCHKPSSTPKNSAGSPSTQEGQQRPVGQMTVVHGQLAGLGQTGGTRSTRSSSRSSSRP